MAKEYRFDYTTAKPNRFAKKLNLNVSWTVEKFVEAANENPKANASANGRAASTKSAQPKAK